MYFFLGYECGYFFRLLAKRSKKIKPLIELEANFFKNLALYPFEAHTFGIWIAAIFASYFREFLPIANCNQIYKLFQEVENE